MQIKKFDTINVIPFIDIMLVLLAVVLTTATFIATGTIQVTLPEAKSGVNMEAEKPVEIGVKEDGSLYLDDEPVTLEALEAKVKELPQESRIVLKTDKAAKFQDFVDVIDLLKRTGRENVAIATVKALKN